MQDAFCRIDGQNWSADRFAALPVSQLEAMRRQLACISCGRDAWFRKESKHGHPAHFCAHHEDSCQLRAIYTVTTDPRDAVTEEAEEISAGGGILVDLDDEKGGEITVNPVAPPPSNTGTGGRTHVLPGDRQSSETYTLKRVLHRLVTSQAFRESSRIITFFRDGEVFISGPIKEVFIPFERAHEAPEHARYFFWGNIASYGVTQDGKLWLNSSENHNESVSVAIFDDILQAFIAFFEIHDLEELVGAHVLVSGHCQTSKRTKKSTIWCGAIRNIILRRYNERIKKG
ncbi:hypothetical protein [Alcanivorax sp. 24]|uniref:hypothetical protein n=1 Tax=Alcanivorax sp. 24 TaxID=2545266 RepID=UPI00105D42BC|nr:hypothetical protein [Alcanivorax sp. 24]